MGHPADVQKNGRQLVQSSIPSSVRCPADWVTTIIRSMKPVLPPANSASVIDLTRWDAEAALRLGVTFDAKVFRFLEYRDDRFADACAYAELDRHRSSLRRPPLRTSSSLRFASRSVERTRSVVASAGSVPLRTDRGADPCARRVVVALCQRRNR